MEKMCKTDLKQFIQNMYFTVTELGLYLDTHPSCPCGLSSYQDSNCALQKAITIYEKKFGPLTMFGVCSDDNWSWSTEPWPWQKGCDY